MSKKLDRYFSKFAMEISKLTPEEYMGVLTVCNINLYRDEEKKEPKDFSETFSELLDKVASYPKARRRNLMLLMKTTNKGR